MAMADIKHVATLKSATKVMDEPKGNLEKTIWAYNLSKLGENLNWTLARVVTSPPNQNSNSNAASSRKSFDSTEFHPKEEDAVANFLQFQVQFDLNKKTLARPPTEIFMTTRSFTKLQWKWLTQLLFNFCQDSLQSLWLRDVGIDAFIEGTDWMETLPKSNDQEGHDQGQQSKLKSSIRSPKLKTFVWHSSSSWWVLTSKKLHLILLLIKPMDRPLEDLWTKSKCEIQIWQDYFCEFSMDPAKPTLWVGFVYDKLRDEICSELLSAVSVAKIYIKSLEYDFFNKGPFNRQLLTHLFVDWEYEKTEVISEVISVLPSFKFLQKLVLWGDVKDDEGKYTDTAKWAMDLQKISGLNNLSFLSLQDARVNCGGVGVNQFPWQPSVQTVSFLDCDFKFKAPSSESTRAAPLTQHLNASLRLERTPSPFQVKSFNKGKTIDELTDCAEDEDGDQRMSEGDEEEGGDEETKILAMMTRDLFN